jgi:hypothetical protein
MAISFQSDEVVPQKLGLSLAAITPRVSVPLAGSVICFASAYQPVCTPCAIRLNDCERRVILPF